jgi:Fe2+ or Zn2+ uptake regulation protein
MNEELVTVLKERGMRVTPQRVVLHRALGELGRHVTADELLDAVADRLPNVSLPTIYATLELFEQLGMVRRVQRAGTTLFDPRVDDHHHLVCVRCGSVQDIEADVDTGALARLAERSGFEPTRVEAVVHGVCAACSSAATVAATPAGSAST